MRERGIGFFEKYLTVWVMLCMGLGLAVGKFLPQCTDVLSGMEVSHVSIPIAVLIWLMIYPVMMKVDFASLKDVGRNPK